MLSPRVSLSSVFLGYNLNLDAIIPLLTSDSIRDFLFFLETHVPYFLDSVLESLSHGKAIELLIDDRVAEALHQKFSSSKIMIGGQEGFFLKNILRHFTPQIRPILHFPSRNHHVLQILQEEISEQLSDVLVFSKDGLRPLSEIFVDSRLSPIHFVFEYPKNVRFTWKKETRITPVANRVILSYDPINFEGVLDPWFLRYASTVINHNWLCLLSGFHLWNVPLMNEDVLDTHRGVLSLLHDRSRWVHVELAYTPIPETREWIKTHVFPYVNSLGLNEVELSLFQANEFHGNRLDQLRQYIHAIKSLRVPVVVFHTHGLYLFYDPHHYFTREAVTKAFSLTEDIIIFDRGMPGSTLEQTWDFNQILKVLAESGVQESMYAYTPKMLSPISSTVGLGDTISSSILLSLFA